MELVLYYAHQFCIKPKPTKSFQKRVSPKPAIPPKLTKPQLSPWRKMRNTQPDQYFCDVETKRDY